MHNVSEALAILLPLPAHCEGDSGVCDLRSRVLVTAPPGLSGEAEFACRWFGASCAGDRDPRDSADSLQERVIRLELGGASQPGEEAFDLSIAPEGVRISAPAASGVFYGLVSLRQLYEGCDGVVPALRIHDAPRFSWRGFMLDTARTFFQVEFLEKMLDLAAIHKLNRFHWHLTDDQAWRLDILGHPEIVEFGSKRLDRRYAAAEYKGGFYSPADVRRVVEYAAARHIVVIPEIETPGHAVALLASHPELSCRGAPIPGSPASRDGVAFTPEDRFGVFEDILCAGDERVFSLLSEVYEYVASVFPGPWVHAGGDEAPKVRWESCPRCRSRMKTENLKDEAGQNDPEKLQAWFMGRVAEALAARGRRMIGWDEVLEGGVRKDTVIMSWRGYSGGTIAAASGYEVVMCPQTSACYLDHRHLASAGEPGRLGVCTVRDSYSFEPVPPGLDVDARCRVLGGQANIWTEIMEFGRQVEYMAFPRLSALAEVFWSPRESRDFGSFTARIHGAHGKLLDLLGVNRYRGPFCETEQFS